MSYQNQNGQQVMVQERGKTLLSRYGSRPEIAELADRIQKVIPVRLNEGQVRRMILAEAQYLAEASLAHGLDPFVGQIYLLVVRDIPTIHIGPAGYEVQATRQLQREGGGNWWPEFERIDDEQARADLLVPRAAIAYRCKLYDSPTIRTWTAAIDTMSRAGAEWREIMSILGSKPFAEGLGFYVPNGGKQDEKYPPHERARKRAFHAALKKRFALEMDGDSDGDLAPDFTGPLRGDMAERIVEQEPAEQGDGGAPAGEMPASAATVDARPAAAANEPPGPPDVPPMDNAALDAEAMRQDGQSGQPARRPLVQRPGTRGQVAPAAKPAAKDAKGRDALYGNE